MSARKMIGVSSSLHEGLSELAKQKGVPMTVVLETFLAGSDQFEWGEVKTHYDANKPSWANMRKAIDDYKLRYPAADDVKLSELTGFSLAQVEAITHSAHKRCLRILSRQPKVKPATLAAQGNVSAKFAMRIWQQSQGVVKVPKAEMYLWTHTGSLPIPNQASLC